MEPVRNRLIHAGAARRGAALALLALTIACARGADPVATPVPAPPAILPLFQRVIVPGLDSVGMVRAIGWVAVSAQGRVAYVDKSSTKGAIVIIDTLGKTVRLTSVGSALRAPVSVIPMFFPGDESDLVVLDADAQRFERFGADGRHRNTSATFDAGMPIGATRDSVDMLLFGEVAVQQSVVRVSMKTLGARTLIDSADSSFASLHGVSPMVSGPRGIVIGRGASYSFQSYSRDGQPLVRWGRDLPPRYMTGTDTRQRERHFYNIVLDGAGRLWALGRDSTGTAFADIFADTTFVGRMRLPCPIAGYDPVFKGEWMAIKCAAPQKGESRIEVQLFRVLT